MEAAEKECEGLGQLLQGYRAMYCKIRQIHGFHASRDQVYTVMTDVDPNELVNRRPIVKKKLA